MTEITTRRRQRTLPVVETRHRPDLLRLNQSQIIESSVKKLVQANQ